MERKFRLLKDLPFADAGTIGEYKGFLTNAYVFSKNEDAERCEIIDIDSIINAPDGWFEEIKEPEMVWQKPEMNKEAASTLYYVSDDDDIYTGCNITEQTITWFSSKEQAEQFAKHLRAGALLRAAIERVNVANGNWKPDWEDKQNAKAVLAIINNELTESYNYTIREWPNCYYFHPISYQMVLQTLGDNATQIIKDFLMI
jgi:hypothetical protein